MSNDYHLQELARLVGRLVMEAVVTERDGARAKVDWGDGVISDWLRIAQLGSGALKFWIPCEPGDPVVVLSPGGNTARGVIYPGPFLGGLAPGVNLTGELTGDGDVVVSGVSLVKHKHSAVRVGPDESGPPVKG